MKTIKRDSGLLIKSPPNYIVAESTNPLRRTTPGRVFGPVPLPTDPVAMTTANDVIVTAFGNQEMLLIDQFEFAPAALTTRQCRGVRSASANNNAEFSLALASNEDAVVLLEQDGMYSWQFASEVTTKAVRSAKRVEPVAAQRQVKFSIALPTGAAPKQRTSKRGVIEDIENLVLDKVKAFIFKFAARVVIGNAINFLERNVRRGLVNMADPDPAKWDLLTDPGSLKLPIDRAARVLLFVHGTFSSTIGGYGALAATPWGQEFLKAALGNYDAVIGFDHMTLSNDPLENATDLLRCLQGIDWPYPPHFDVITHSRGGLVLRSLTEHLLPLSNFPASFERIIFVAATNGGTLLAEPDNWHALIDLYTNLTVSACRLIGMMPQAKAVTVILNEIVQGLGAFVKYCATTVADERVVPGLAAMQPNGEFIRQLNQEQFNQPTIEQSYYCAITSDFNPRLMGGDHEPKELSRRMVQWIADVFTEQLMKEPNDLVVNTASMISIDPQLGKCIKDSLDFGNNPQVYHTNYFVRPEVINALTRWLRLTKPMEAAEPPPVMRRGKSKEEVESKVIYAPRKTSRQPDAIGMGGIVGPEVPAVVDTDIFVTSAAIPVSETLETIKKVKPSYVVVRRDYRGETLNYAFSTEEVMEKGSGFEDHTPLLHALNLHETDCSDTRSVTGWMEPPVFTGGMATTMRAVVLIGNQPVGVLPEKTELPSGADLVSLTHTVSAPKIDGDFIQTRRTMPTFSASVMELPILTRSRSGSRSAPVMRGGKKTTLPITDAVPKVTCHFHAEMDQEVLVKRPATVEVLISREAIGQLLHAAAAEGKGEIDPTRKLLIQVLPKVNFESLDEGWAEIDPPASDGPQTLYFILRATHAGEGEIWVVARQGQVPLVTLVLKPQIVKAKGEGLRRTQAMATTQEAPKLSAPLHQLIITERRNGESISYRYQLQSPELKLLKWADSKPIVGDRSKYVANLYKEIENRWLSNQDDVEDFTQELRAIGAAMFNELIPEELQHVLWDYRNQIKSIMVIAEEPFIPWELVHLNQPGEPLSEETRFLGQMGLVRWLQEAGWPPEQLTIREGKARYVIPNYPHPNYILPEAEQEYQFLEKNFSAIKVQPTSSAVRKLLSQPGAFDLLHFACHGVADQDNISNAQLLMEGRLENGAYLPDYFSATTAEYLTNLNGDDNAPMIVLNACQAGRAGYNLTGIGGFAHAFLRRGAGAFISTLWSVGDSPARSFTEEFYSQLLKGLTIAEATIKAREKARQKRDATWLAYVVYGHPHAKLNG